MMDTVNSQGKEPTILKEVILGIDREMSHHQFQFEESGPDVHGKLREIIDRHSQRLPDHLTPRVRSEFLGLGPLEEILEDEEISEILLQEKKGLSLEKAGVLQLSREPFYSSHSYERIFNAILEEAGLELTVEIPFAQGRWREFRLHAARPPVSKTLQMTLRRLGHLQSSLEDLFHREAFSNRQKELLEELVVAEKNLLVVGATGSGKTTLLNALIHQVSASSRVVILEDTDELCSPNAMSTKILTRMETVGGTPPVDLAELVRQSLRMRPDRLVMGEVRGSEAKDLLMALATGHRGSFSTLHAEDAAQALLRLEMLIQLGAPQWNLEAVRRLISLSIDHIIVMRKVSAQRKVEGIFKLCGVESFGLLLEQVD